MMGVADRPAERAQAGDGEGGAAQIRWGNVTGARGCGQPFHFPGQVEQRAPISVANHRDHEPLGGLRGQADVVLVPLHDLARLFVEIGIELGLLLERLHRGPDEEGQVAELDVVAGQARLGLVAQFDQLGGVDLLHISELGHLTLGAQHVLGDFSADAAERDADVAGHHGPWGGRHQASRHLGRAHVFGRDLAAWARAGDCGERHVHFARQLAHHRSGQHALGRVDRRGRHRDRGRRRRGTGRGCHRARRPVLVVGWYR